MTLALCSYLQRKNRLRERVREGVILGLSLVIEGSSGDGGGLPCGDAAPGRKVSGKTAIILEGKPLPDKSTIDTSLQGRDRQYM